MSLTFNLNDISYLIIDTGYTSRFLDESWVRPETDKWYHNFDLEEYDIEEQPNATQYEKLVNRGAIFVAGSYPRMTPDLHEMIHTPTLSEDYNTNGIIIFSLSDVPDYHSNSAKIMLLIEYIMNRSNQKSGCGLDNLTNMSLYQLKSGRYFLYVDTDCEHG